MSLIPTGRGTARNGRIRMVPGGLACAASSRHLLFSPTLLQVSSTLKLAPGFSKAAVTRLKPNPA